MISILFRISDFRHVVGYGIEWCGVLCLLLYLYESTCAVHVSFITFCISQQIILLCLEFAPQIAHIWIPFTVFIVGKHVMHSSVDVIMVWYMYIVCGFAFIHIWWICEDIWGVLQYILHDDVLRQSR